MTYIHRGAQGDPLILSRVARELCIDEVLKQYNTHQKCDISGVGKIIIDTTLKECEGSEAFDALKQLFREYSGVVKMLKGPARSAASYTTKSGTFAGFSNHYGCYEDRLDAFLGKLADIGREHNISFADIVVREFAPAPVASAQPKLSVAAPENQELLDQAKERLCRGLGIPVPQEKNVYEIWEQYSALAEVNRHALLTGVGKDNIRTARLFFALSRQEGLTVLLRTKTQENLETVEEFGRSVRQWAGREEVRRKDALQEILTRYEIEVTADSSAKTKEITAAIVNYIGDEALPDVIVVAKHLLARRVPLSVRQIHVELENFLIDDIRSSARVHKETPQAFMDAMELVLEHPECKPLWDSIRQEHAQLMSAFDAEIASRRIKPKPADKPSAGEREISLLNGLWTLKITQRAREMLVDLLAQDGSIFSVTTLQGSNQDGFAQVIEELPGIAVSALANVRQNDNAALNFAITQINRQCNTLYTQRLNKPMER